MPNQNKPRRQFLKDSVKASGLMIMSPLIPKITSAATTGKQQEIITAPNRIKFAVINIKHLLTGASFVV